MQQSRCLHSFCCSWIMKKFNSLVFPLAFAVRKYEKVQQSRVPDRFFCLKAWKCRKKRGSLSSETRKCRKIRGSLSSETRKLLSSLQFVYFQETHALEKVAPAIKVIVWDCDFLALGGQRPFWELWKCHRISKKMHHSRGPARFCWLKASKSCLLYTSPSPRD